MNKYVIIILLLMPCALYAQSERRDVRHGNKLFSQGKYVESEKSYQSALDKNSASKEAAFNLGAALYKQGRWADAQQTYTTLGNEAGASATFNLGNACFQQRNEQGKLDQAIESYKASLRINPSDMEAKFNLAYAQKLKKEQDNKDKNDKDKDKDKNQDQDKDQKDQNKDQEKQDDKKDDQPKDQGKQDQKNKDQKPEPQSQSKQDAERMLKAIQAAENKTQEKVDAEKVKAVGASRSSKDW